MKKLLMMSLMATTGIALVGCGTGGSTPSAEEREAEIQQALQAGSAIAISQIIEQAVKAPCETVYLFNRSDEENPLEVNLINVACEELDLPEIPSPSFEEAPVEATEQ